MVKPPAVTYSVKRRVLRALSGLVQALHAHVILGVNLEADSSVVAAAEAWALGCVGYRHSLLAHSACAS
jgi:hypothetical protein